MRRFKLNFAVMAFVLGSVVAFTQSAFTPARKLKSGKVVTQYQFNGTILSQDKSAANYSVASGSPSCPSGTTLPCTISVDGDLQTWLNARTATQIRDMADQKKN